LTGNDRVCNKIIKDQLEIAIKKRSSADEREQNPTKPRLIEADKKMKSSQLLNLFILLNLCLHGARAKDSYAKAATDTKDGKSEKCK
jgi:hypothetical protein